MTAARDFIPVAEPDLGPLEERYLLEAFRSGWVSSIGAYVDRFEAAFAAFCGVRHAVAVSNGTAALHVALLAAGVSPGDEVIVPALTFVATAAAVRHAGAEPVFVDSEPEIGTLDPAAVERAVGPRTKAIVPVHLYGHPADMDPILRIARQANLAVVEDAAEAHGASYKGRRVGSLGDLATFSFYGNKILTTGEGGMVVTADKALADRVRFLKDHAMDPQRRYWHPEVGYNYRMTNLQAALGLAQLERFADLCAGRQAVLDLYREIFRGLPEVRFNPARDWASPVPWLVCALLSERADAAKRDALMARLKSGGVDSRPYFHPVSAMPPYAGCRRVGADGDGLPVAEKLSGRGMNLPSLIRLARQDVVRVREAFAAALSHIDPDHSLRTVRL
jgi:perosamine synthetase